MIRNIQVPTDPVDVVLDTDAYNEIDDQFALAYLLLAKEKLHTKAIYAAPFFNARVSSVQEGMEQSYREIVAITEMMGEKVHIFAGSGEYLPDEQTPVRSPAAADLARRAMAYTEEHPLYVVAIGAITNIASALLLHPAIAKRMVLVWLGGHAHHYDNTREFNMRQDVAAARVVMGSGVPLVQLPCYGVVSSFRISKPELEYWLKGKNDLCDYLADAAIAEADSYAEGKPWTRCIWDVAAVAWLLNDREQFMKSRSVSVRLPGYDHQYEAPLADVPPMEYVYFIYRDALMEDLIGRLLQFQNR